MGQEEKIVELEQEVKDLKASHLAIVKMKDNQLQDFRIKLLEMEKICGSLERNIRSKDNELARTRQ